MTLAFMLFPVCSRYFRMRIKLVLSLLLLACPMLAQADLVIRGSRIIYEEARGETTVDMQQIDNTPRLVQLWLDDGNDSGRPGEMDIPFLITPAVNRMDPHTGQTARIRRIGDIMPQDRESLFWLNALEIPPAPTRQVEAGDNFIQFASRIRMKFFYRPKGLQPAPEQALQLLQFSRSNTDMPDGRIGVRVHNASPYHITFRGLSLRQNAGEDAPVLAELVPGDWMVEPMAELALLLQPPPESATSPPLSDGTQVVFGVVNDQGGVITGQQPLDVAK